MTPRFFAPDARGPNQTIVLPEDEATHLTRVLRLSPGSLVRVFNGQGKEFEAVVSEVMKFDVLVRITEPRTPTAAEASVAVTLAQAVPRGDRMDDVVRDAVMMGVAAIQPVVATRTDIALGALARSRRRSRWERIAVASAKQCGRATVPPVLEPCAWPGVLAALAQRTLPTPGIMLVEPSATTATPPLRDLAATRPSEATMIIGPEGGWTSDEVLEGSAQCQLVTLGSRTIRADAMALVALSALFAIWQEY